MLMQDLLGPNSRRLRQSLIFLIIGRPRCVTQIHEQVVVLRQVLRQAKGLPQSPPPQKEVEEATGEVAHVLRVLVEDLKNTKTILKLNISAHFFKKNISFKAF